MNIKQVMKPQTSDITVMRQDCNARFAAFGPQGSVARVMAQLLSSWAHAGV